MVGLGLGGGDLVGQRYLNNGLVIALFPPQATETLKCVALNRNIHLPVAFHYSSKS